MHEITDELKLITSPLTSYSRRPPMSSNVEIKRLKLTLKAIHSAVSNKKLFVNIKLGKRISKPFLLFVLFL